MKIVVFLILAIFLCNCSGSEKEECAFIPDIASSPPLAFESFGDSLANIKSKSQLVDILTRHPVIRDQMLRRAEYPNDSVFIDEMYKRFSNPYIDTLLAETRNVFGDFTLLKSQFQDAFANIRYYYPDFKIPKVETIITGLDTDLFVSDSLIIVSVDFFLGPNARFRPKTYDYLMRRYDPDDIVPSSILIYGISERFNKTELRDKTVLADMIAYGKSFYFAKRMMPCTPDSILIWYNEEEIRGARQNEDLIWARFIQDKILFSTGMMEKKNYLGDRPITTQVGEKCPGRIGQWVGWQIVKEYMKSHPEKSLPELMRMGNAQALFKESNYKPKSGKK